MSGFFCFLFFCRISCFLFSRGFPISCFSLGFLFFYWRVFVLDGKKRMELGTKELQSSLVRGSVAPAAAGLGDKRNLSFRAVRAIAVRFLKKIFQLKTRRSMILVLADPYLRGSDNFTRFSCFIVIWDPEYYRQSRQSSRNL